MCVCVFMCMYVCLCRCACVCLHLCAAGSSGCTSSALHVLPVVVSGDVMCAAASLCVMLWVHHQMCIFWEIWGKLTLPLIKLILVLKI